MLNEPLLHLSLNFTTFMWVYIIILRFIISVTYVSKTLIPLSNIPSPHLYPLYLCLPSWDHRESGMRKGLISDFANTLHSHSSTTISLQV